MFGSHLSVAGGMTQALDEARTLGLDCVQVFTKNQQQWNVKPLDPSAINTWKAALAHPDQWPAQPQPAPRVTSHASYLINMASPDPELRAKSIALMKIELDRCAALGIELLVFHPGAATSGTPDDAIHNIAHACSQLLQQTANSSTVLCLENVAGAGTTIGRTLDELAHLRRLILANTPSSAHTRIGFCLDTCHAHAAGYDLSSPDSANRFMDQVEDTLGVPHVRCWHFNDSKGPAASRLDRHQHIGEGTIGMLGFATILKRPWVHNLPKIMETPKGPEDTKGAKPAKAWDLINLHRLRGLMHNTLSPTDPIDPIDPIDQSRPTKKPTKKPAKAPTKNPPRKTQQQTQAPKR
jgi:deoxyribonuclease IV